MTDPTTRPARAQARPGVRARTRTRTAAAAGAVTGLTALALIASATSAAAASGATAADRAIAAHLKTRFPAAHLGGNAVGLVLDAASGRTVWSSRSGTGEMPASTEKLATAVIALYVLGPGHTVRTRTVRSGSTLYLVGGGDQYLTTAALKSLAASTAKALKAAHRTTVTLRVDDSLFPAPALSPGWNSGYYPETLAPVRALALLDDQSSDTAVHAGKVFAAQLAALGVHASAPKRAKAPKGASAVASHTSAPLSTAIEYMLKQSDNNIAEGVARLAALGEHRAATWQGVDTTVRSVLGHYKIPLAGVKIYDGSGLSRSDRMTANALTRLVALAVNPADHAALWPILPGLPVAGRDGTLSAAEGRFTTSPSKCAAGKVDAKTGTLTGATALAGLTKGKDGRWKAFAFVENGLVSANSTAQARNGVDGLAATVNGCW